MYMCLFACVHVCLCVYMCVCISVCTHVCVYTYMCVICLFVCEMEFMETINDILLYSRFMGVVCD